MKYRVRHADRWGVILAGGDGNRLRPLTRYLSGDDRPKQFCAISGTRTLLADTVARVTRIVHPEHLVFVVTRKHQPYYERDLWGVRRSRIVEQTENRGTTVAIASALARIQRVPGDALVACFPADHHYGNEAAVQQALDAAYEAAADMPDRLVLVGAKATTPDVGLGWIDVGPELASALRRRSATGACAVRQFVEKPPAELAADLFARGCLWNTFITVGRQSAFQTLLREFAADATTSDFSRDVLSRCADRLAVVPLRDSGWADLGQPVRALAVMTQQSVRRPSLRLAAS